MSVYTVHVQSADASAANARFIRDGFSWAALIFGPLWLLAHRLWLAFLMYSLVMTLTAALAQALGLNNGLAMLLSELISVYVALEAHRFWQYRLENHGWPMVDIVTAANLEAAERIFYSRWPDQRPAPSASVPPQSVRYSGTEILGLFPQKGM